MNPPADAPDLPLKAPTMAELVQFAQHYALVAAAAAVLLLPAFVLWRLRRSHFLPLQRMRWIHWQGIEVIQAILLTYFLPGLVLSLLRGAGWFTFYYGQEPSPERQFLWAGSLSQVLALALILAILHLVSQTRLAELGLSPVRWPQNALLGFLGFLVCTPVVNALFWLIALVIPGKAHFAVAVGKLGLAPVEWGLLFFLIIVAAPVIEEVIFRGLMQGWLRRAGLPGHFGLFCIVLLFGLGMGFAPTGLGQRFDFEWGQEPHFVEVNFYVLIFTAIVLGGYYRLVQRQFEQNLLMSAEDFAQPKPAEFSRNGTHEGPMPDELPDEVQDAWYFQDLKQRQTKTWISIYGAAMFWAIVHMEAWPSPIPLFFFGLALGWMTYRTQSLVPAVVTHGLFNLVSTLGVFAER